MSLSPRNVLQLIANTAKTQHLVGLVMCNPNLVVRLEIGKQIVFAMRP